MITINYDDSGCGDGKTHRAMRSMTEVGGRHLYVVERVDTMTERARELQSIATELGRFITTDSIRANADHRLAGRSVTARVETIPDDYRTHQNIVVFITHEAMKLANFESFAGEGWSIWIDEVPDILDQGKHRFCETWPKLEEMYQLHPTAKGNWSRATVIDGAPDIRALAQDDGLEMLRPFHRRLSDPRRDVFVNITKWDELAVRGKELSWYSLWCPNDLQHFEGIFLLGNRLKSSATVAILQAKWPEIEWRQMRSSPRRFAWRNVKITYFAESHCASRALFSSERGQDNLRKIAEYIDFRVPPGEHIWSCNERYRSELDGLGGRWLSPRQSGSNRHSRVTNATMIFTAKPEPSVRAIYERLGIDPDLFTVSAEREIILQFICRTALRLPDDMRDVRLWVYDRAQAEYLRDYFADDPRGYVKCELRLENLGFAYQQRDSKPGRRKVALTPEQAEAKKVADRIKDRDRKRRERAEKVPAANDDADRQAA